MPLALSVALLISDRTAFERVLPGGFLSAYILEVAAGLIWRYMYDGNYGVVAVIYSWFGLEAPQVLAEKGWAMAAFWWSSFGNILVFTWRCLLPAGRASPVRSSRQRKSMAPVAGNPPCVVLPMMKHVIVLLLQHFGLACSFFDMIIPLTDGGRRTRPTRRCPTCTLLESSA